MSADEGAPREASPATPSSGSEGGSPAAPAPVPAPHRHPSRLRRWLRRASYALTVLVILLSIARVVLAFELPSIVANLARGAGLSCTWERLDLSLVLGELELTHLALVPIEGGEPIAKLAYLRLDLSPSALVSGRIALRRLEVDGADLKLEREADGVLAIVRRIQRAQAEDAASKAATAQAPEKPGSERAGEETPTSVSIAIDALRLSHVHLRVQDASVKPALDAKLEFDLSLTDFHFRARGKRPAHLEITASFPPVLELLRIEGAADLSGQNGSLDLEIALDHAHLQPLAGYLERAGVRPAARDISFGASLRASTHPAFSGQGGIGGTLTLEHLRASADGEEALSLDRLAVDAISLSKRELDLSNAVVDGVRANASRLEDGAIRVGGLELRPVPSPGETAPVASSQEGARTDTESFFRFALKDLTVRDVRATFRDAKTSPNADLAAVLDVLHVRDVLRDQGSPVSPASVEARIRAPGVAESIALVGSAVPFGKDRSADLALSVTGIAPRALAPYLEPRGITSLLERGSLEAKLHANASLADDGKVGLDAALRDLVLRDAPRGLGVELAAIDLVRAAGVHISPEPRSLSIGELEIAAPRFHARREKDGSLVGLGFRLRKKNGSGAAPEALRPPEGPVESGAPGKRLERLSVGRVWLHDVSCAFQDELESTSLEVPDAGLDLRKLEAVLDPKAPPPAPAKLRAWVNARDVARVDLQGTLVASATRPKLALALDAQKLTLKAISPYLAKAGIHPHFKDGMLNVVLSGEAKIEPEGPAEADLALESLRVLELEPQNETELFLLEGLKVQGAKLLPRPTNLERVTVGLLDLGKLHARATAKPSGVLEALGLEIEKRPEETAPVASETVTAPPTAAKPFMVRVEKIRAGEIAFDLRDATREPAIDFPFRGQLEAGPIGFDPAAKNAADDAPFQIALALPGAVERLTLVGTIAPSPRRSAFHATVEASGLTLGLVAPRLREHGIEPRLRSGELRFELSGERSSEGPEPEAGAVLEKLVLKDGDDELVGVDAVRARGIHVAPKRFGIEEVEVARPRARVEREAAGNVLACGLAFGQPRVAEPTPEPRPDEKEKAQSFEVYKLDVKDTALDWTDRAVPGGAHVQVLAEAALENLIFGIHAPIGKVRARVRVPGALETLSVAGKFVLGGAKKSFDLDLDLDGARAGPLSPYLQGTTRLLLKDGRAHAAVRARIEDNDQGGVSVRGEIAEVEVRDGPDSAPCFKLDQVRLIARRLDPKGGILAIDDLLVNGLDAEIDRDQEGATRALGFAFLPKKTQASETGNEAEPKEGDENDQGTRKPRRERPPLVDLWKVAANVRSLTFRDLGKPEAAPLVFSNVRLQNKKPLAFLGPDPAAQPALELELSGTVAPIVSRATVALRLAPWAQEPSFAIDLAAEGVRGPGLTEIAPALAESLDGSHLVDGRIKGTLELELRTHRRDPLDWDLSRGYGLDLALRKLEVRDGDGPVLLGLDELMVDAARIDPRTGSAHYRSIEITKPAGRLANEADGLHFLGLVKKARPQEAETPKATETSSTEKSKGKTRIDRLVVSDVDFVYRDGTCDPPFVIPLNDIDLDLANIVVSDGKWRSIRFDGVAKAGNIPLAKREKKLFPKQLFSKIADLVTDKKVELEDRPFVLEIATKGDLELTPRPLGHLRFSVSGLELAGFKGLAKKSDIVLKDGVTDLDFDFSFETEGLVPHAVASFADLEVTEKKNGWIQRRFLPGIGEHLPGIEDPLALVQFALKDADGNITLDLDPPGHIQRDTIGEEINVAVFEALPLAITKLALEAIYKNVPLRVLNAAKEVGQTALDLLPGFSDLFEKKAEAIDPLSVAFAPGEPQAAAAELEKLAAFAKRVKDKNEIVLTLRHELGSADLARAAELGNPSPADRLDLLARLRARRSDLDERRKDAQAEVRSLLLASKDDAGARAAIARLQALETELGNLDRALETVYDLAREGAEHKTDRRTRASALELARARLELVRAALVAQGISDPERIRVPSPRFGDGNVGGGIVTIFATVKPKK